MIPTCRIRVKPICFDSSLLLPSRYRGTSAIWSPILITGFNAAIASWNIIEALLEISARRSVFFSVETSFPSKKIFPLTTSAFVGSSPSTAFKVIDFPLPDSPTIPIASPGFTSNETPRIAFNNPRPVLISTDKFCTEIKGVST